jgi:hypothetical protein
VTSPRRRRTCPRRGDVGLTSKGGRPRQVTSPRRAVRTGP